MKLFFLCGLAFSIQCFGQKWHLNNYDEKKEYAYEYWFQLENLKDTSSYRLNKKVGRKSSTLKLIDNQENTISFASIRIINLDNGLDTTLISDFSGLNKYTFKKGKYRILLKASNYDEFELEFEIEHNQHIDLTIQLGLAPELAVYQIDSKIELTEKELLTIMECVRINRKEYHHICGDSESYQISLQI